MSRHYNPHLTDPDLNPFTRSWRAVVQQCELTTAWLAQHMKAALEWCLRPGASPPTAATWQSRHISPTIPTLEEIEREFERDRPRTADGDPFPGPADRYRAQLEKQLSAMKHRPPS